MVLPSAELSVDEDFVVGTVPLDSVEELEVRKLAFDRLRKSLKKGMTKLTKRLQSTALSSGRLV